MCIHMEWFRNQKKERERSMIGSYRFFKEIVVVAANE